MNANKGLRFDAGGCIVKLLTANQASGTCLVIRCIISLSVIGMIGKTFLSYCYCDGVAFDTEQFNLP